MQEWMHEEWACLAAAEANHSTSAAGFVIHVWSSWLIKSGIAGDADVIFQLHSWQDTLLQLCYVWQTDALSVPTNELLGSLWGPTREELLATATCAVTGTWDECEVSTYLEDVNQLLDSNRDPDNLDLLEAVELADYVDSYYDYDT